MSPINLPDVQREKICHLAQKSLWEDADKDVEEAREYLLNKRKISRSVLEEYNFGYIPRRARHNWSERIVMPLYNPYGDLTILTTRKFRSNDPKEYPHLHETFNKRFYLYGLNVAKEDIIKNNRAVVVEGQIDTLRMRSMKFKSTVGILGSAFTLEHACVLRRYCDKVYLVFDHDESGLSTLLRSMKMAIFNNLPDVFDMTFIPVILPKKEGEKKIDPDGFLDLHGPKEMLEVLEYAEIERKQFSFENLEKRIEQHGVYGSAKGGSGSK